MFTPDTITARDAHADMRAHAGRILAARGGWQRHDSGATGSPWGHHNPRTGAVIVPAPLGGAGQWRERWAVGVRAEPDTFHHADNLGDAIRWVDSLPDRPEPEPEPTHYDGHGAPCWCDQPTARR